MKKEENTCKSCGESFLRKFKSQIFCCKCIKLTDYFSSGREKTREYIRIRDNHTCQKCGKKWEEGMRRFDVHHIDCDKEKSKKYDNYEKEKDNMITYCHKCHLNLPEHRKAVSDGLRKS